VFKQFFRRIGKDKVILLAWELGGGLGHIQRLLVIANELTARGYRVAFALQRVDNAEIITRALPGAQVMRAPLRRLKPGPRVNGTAYNYADVLHRCGYDAAVHLGPVVSEWRELLQSLAPVLVVADHSPPVVLAAAGRVPVVHIGSGFTTRCIRHRPTARRNARRRCFTRSRRSTSGSERQA
jgi:rhamnosyltransferase subunit B